MSIFKDKEAFLNQYDQKDFNIENQIGKGSYGEVYRVQNKMNKKIYAIKRLIPGDESNCEQVENEMKIQFALPEHPNIIKLHQIFKFDYQESTVYFIELDLAESSLSSLIKSNKEKINEETILQYLTETIDGCLFLKKNKIFHRDIKPDNILIRKGHPKLVDFGESKQQENKKTMSTMTLTGTPAYLSPLLYNAYISGKKQCKHDAEKSDVYSLGLTFLRLITKCDIQLFCGNQNEQQRQDAISPLLKQVNSTKLKEALGSMLEFDEIKRATFQQIDDLLKGVNTSEKKNNDSKKVQQIVSDDATIKLPQHYLINSKPEETKKSQEEVKTQQKPNQMQAQEQDKKQQESINQIVNSNTKQQVMEESLKELDKNHSDYQKVVNKWSQIYDNLVKKGKKGFCGKETDRTLTKGYGTWGYCGTTTGTKSEWNWKYGFYCCEDCWKEGEGSKN